MRPIRRLLPEKLPGPVTTQQLDKNRGEKRFEVLVEFGQLVEAPIHMEVVVD